ncbi:MAG TPA: isoprenylcysteine carboxylmethyltransferase family protein [Burkholderiaceae bacterium]|nr:isoprenylcysteine carboxylmethyltransferase family protein [Burkholderiaceae bacterium]
MRTCIPPPFIMFFSAALMWALHRWLPLLEWPGRPWNRLGGLIVAAGIVVSASAFMNFKRAGTTVDPRDPGKASRLVTGGVFRFSRNPMYLGLLLVLIGWALLLGSASVWVVPPLFVAGITHLQIIPEEQALVRLFGDEYLAYRRGVARWFGRIR